MKSKEYREMDIGFIKLPLSKLVKADWNYKKEDPVMMAKLVANLKRNGQVENIIIRELKTGFFEVVNGNHRLDAMISLDMTEAECYNLGGISPAAAKRIATETNETRFPTDELRLHELIVEMMDEFSAEDLALTIPVEIPSFDESEIPEEFPEYNEKSADGVELCRCEACGHEHKKNK
jgi:ParB-like chromosome segregation protein Spo0J